MAELVKLHMERNIHVSYYYEPGTNFYIVEAWLNDYAHDCGMKFKADMDTWKITECEFITKTIPKNVCTKAKALCDGIIGMDLKKDFTPNVIQKLLGKDGCENLMELITTAGGAMLFVYYRHLIERGEMSWEQFGKQLFVDRMNSCIAFNPAYFDEANEDERH